MSALPPCALVVGLVQEMFVHMSMHGDWIPLEALD